jgi:uncharacterized membrane protein YeaQ/YmgE (transglycosylase-associated protein family)
MGIIGWIVLGGLAGWIASMIMGTDKSMGVLANIAVGIVGALIGGFLVSLFGGSGVGVLLWPYSVPLSCSVSLRLSVAAVTVPNSAILEITN